MIEKAKKVLSLFLALTLVFSVVSVAKIEVSALDSRVEAAISWAIAIANDDSHGYDRNNRNGPNYDCSSFVSTAFKQGGFNISGSLSTSNMADALVNVGFTKYSKGSVSIQRGDILLKPGTHVELYLGNDTCVAAHSNRDGKSGDSSGKEIEVRKKSGCEFCRDANYTYILRYNGTSSGSSSNTYSSTNPDDYTYPTRTLKYTSPTMKGSDVAWVQAVLKKLGYSVTIDGSYGPATRDTIKQFQKAYGLEVDGFCGPKTRAKLLELWNKIKHTHSYTGTVTKSPTCTATGVKTFKCSCGASYTQSIAALGHLYSAYWTVDKAATCTQTGEKSRHCGRCSSRTDITTIPAKGHTSSVWITDTTASVYSAGSKHRECTVCGTVLETVKTAQAVPSKVKLGKISNTASGVKITWSKAAGADSYKVFRRISSGSWEYIGATSSTAYTDKTAKSGTAYYYTVRGINEGGNGSYDTKGLYIRCVGTPKLTKIANATTSVKISWSKVAGADGYYVYRKASGATSWTKIANIKNGSTTSYKDTKVSSGKNYTYTVKAYDGGTKSSHDSKGLTIKFLATPKLLYVSTGKSGITVKWDKVTGANGYIVYRKTGSGSWAKIATVKGNSKVSYLDKTAKKGKTYTYTVKAYSGDYRSYYNTKGLTIKDKY